MVRLRPSSWGAWLALGALPVLLLATSACAPTSYPVDIFPEMHYQPTHRRLEPRRLSPPRDAVPINGAKPTLSYAEATPLTNPFPQEAATSARSAKLYQVNCAMCHGPAGRGDSLVAEYFQRAGALPPTDFSSARVRARTEGQLYWILRYGLGNMPPYDDLLTEQEVWLLVSFVRALGAR